MVVSTFDSTMSMSQSASQLSAENDNQDESAITPHCPQLALRSHSSPLSSLAYC